MSAPDDPLGEEARAQLWRDETRARIAYQQSVWAGLRAPPEPRQRVLVNWQPVLAWQLERQAGDLDPKDDP